MELPENAYMLLSFVNTKLRDDFPSLSAFCADCGVSENELKNKLSSIGYTYDEALNKFI